jgi:translin
LRDLKAIIDEIEKELDEKDTVREVALKSCRAIGRLSVLAIKALHRGEEASRPLTEARDEASKLKSILADHPDLFHSGFVEAAQQELVEAAVGEAAIRDARLPNPKDLAVTPAAYLLGLGDAVGELRRFALESLRDADMEGATRFLEMMEAIYDELMRFDYPSGLVAVKRKQDVARGLIEKTRGELVVAIRGKELERRIDDLKGKL